jgi:spoIIIJ-associated protein
LIGNDGINISAINHLIKKIAWKEVNEQAPSTEKLDFFIDVNDYQEKNIERIKNQALDLAEKVALFKRDIEMSPMSSYERMVVHALLADNPHVFTESIGEKNFRRLIIKSK